MENSASPFSIDNPYIDYLSFSQENFEPSMIFKKSRKSFSKIFLTNLFSAAFRISNLALMTL